MTAPFIAATASPRRHRILESLGVVFTVFEPECAEIHDASDAVRTVTCNALAKHAACAKRNSEAWILAADTVVEFEGRSLGKPSSPEEAANMLLSFSGKPQHIFTAVAMSTPGQAPALRVAASSVLFREYAADTVTAYLEQAKTFDRAGAYDIATCGDMLIASHCGSYTNIMGLPSEIVGDWLAANAYPFKPSTQTAGLPS